MKNEHVDVRAGSSIGVEQLMFYLEQGREIEFMYKGEEYFIAHSKEGRSLWKGNQRISADFESTQLTDFIDVSIHNRSIKDVFASKQRLIQTIF